jgi:hypothetical protein
MRARARLRDAWITVVSLCVTGGAGLVHAQPAGTPHHGFHWARRRPLLHRGIRLLSPLVVAGAVGFYGVDVDTVAETLTPPAVSDRVRVMLVTAGRVAQGVLYQVCET